MLGIAYRMLGIRAEAEDVVQDAWLRWREADASQLGSAEAWLVTVVTRISIDRLRAAKAQREHYVGFWLPEPVVQDEADSPHVAMELADNASVAFLAVLERLGPEERAAFLLHEVFDAGYDEIAAALGKTEAACRQLVHRARAHVREGRPRFTVDRARHLKLLHQFADAAGRGDIQALKAMLVEDAELIGDGGGIVPSFGKVLVGGQRLAQLYYATARKQGDQLHMQVAEVNGEPGLVRWIGGVLESVHTFEWDSERIVRIHAQRNPEKLARVSIVNTQVVTRT